MGIPQPSRPLPPFAVDRRSDKAWVSNGDLSNLWLGPMNPAAPTPPTETVRLPLGAEVGSGTLTITLCRPGCQLAPGAR